MLRPRREACHVGRLPRQRPANTVGIRPSPGKNFSGPRDQRCHGLSVYIGRGEGSGTERRRDGETRRPNRSDATEIEHWSLGFGHCISRLARRMSACMSKADIHPRKLTCGAGSCGWMGKQSRVCGTRNKELRKWPGAKRRCPSIVTFRRRRRRNWRRRGAVACQPLAGGAIGPRAEALSRG